METGKNRKIIVGIFILTGFILFTVAVFIIGDRQSLFTPTFKLMAEFETVSGLKTGASVRMSGINVGKVDDIKITGKNKVEVQMSIQSNIKKFIKKDSKVQISSEGLVGNKVIEILPGSADSPPISEGEKIESTKPVEVQDIISGLKETSDNANEITRDLAEITRKVNMGEGTLGQLVNNDQLYRSIDTSMRSFVTISSGVNQVISKITGSIDIMTTDVANLNFVIRKITQDIAEITKKMNSSESIVGTLLTDTAFANNLKTMIENASATSKNLENGSFSFAQNMEALKHNFLFKGYFEDIGYWDKTDWEKNIDKKTLELRIKEQQLIKKEKELKALQDKIKLEQKLLDERK